MAKRSHSMTLDECAAKMQRFLAARPRSAKTRAYLQTLPKRKNVSVSAQDYISLASEKDKKRYMAWVERGKPSSPSVAPKLDRKRPSAQRRSNDRCLLEEMAAIQGYRCLLCGTHLDTDSDFPSYDDRRPSFDHVTPRSLGGSNAGNRLIAHRKCNSEKSNRRPTGCELVWLAAVNAILAITPSPSPRRLTHV